MDSDLDRTIIGRFVTVKTVDPCEEKVSATVASRPPMIVITAMTAVTPTMMPRVVRKVRSLLLRRLIPANRTDSRKIRIDAPNLIRGQYTPADTVSDCDLCHRSRRAAARSAYFLVGFDAAVSDGDDSVGPGCDVVFVGHEYDGVAFLVQFFEQRHDLVACFGVEGSGRFVRQ